MGAASNGRPVTGSMSVTGGRFTADGRVSVATHAPLEQTPEAQSDAALHETHTSFAQRLDAHWLSSAQTSPTESDVSKHAPLRHRLEEQSEPVIQGTQRLFLQRFVTHCALTLHVSPRKAIAPGARDPADEPMNGAVEVESPATVAEEVPGLDEIAATAVEEAAPSQRRHGNVPVRAHVCDLDAQNELPPSAHSLPVQAPPTEFVVFDAFEPLDPEDFVLLLLPDLFEPFELFDPFELLEFVELPTLPDLLELLDPLEPLDEEIDAQDIADPAASSCPGAVQPGFVGMKWILNISVLPVPLVRRVWRKK